MAIILNDNLSIQAPKGVDSRYGPYVNTTIALSTVTSAVRYQGLTVGINSANASANGGNTTIEYWWRDGIADGDLTYKIDPTATLAYTQANNAYNAANSGSSSTYAFNQANLAYTQANNAYNAANSGSSSTYAFNQANAAFSQANVSFNQANTVFTFANGVNAYAYAAFAFANTLSTNESQAFNTANAAYGQANVSFSQANVIFNNVNTFITFISGVETSQNTNIVSSFTQANNAYNEGNSAASFANGAFTVANAAVIRSGDTMTGNLVIAGANLVVGNAFSAFSNGNVVISQTNGQITLNANTYAGHLLPTANADGTGVGYDLGSATRRWRKIYVSGTTIDLGGGTIQASGNGISLTSPTGASFSVAGSGTSSVGSFSNITANSGIDATNSISGTIIVTGGIGISNNAFIGGNTTISYQLTANQYTFGLDGTNQYTAAAPYAYSNAAFLNANSAYTAQNITASFANAAFLNANSSYSAQNITASFANAAYIAQNTTANFANGSYLASNSAAIFANGAFTTANSAASNTVILQGIENSQNTNISSAFAQANVSYTAQNTTAGFANGAFATANASYASQNITASFANSAYSFANNINTYAYAAYTYANTLGNFTVQAVYNTANNASNIANASFTQANNVYTAQNTTANFANASYTFANSINTYAYSAYAAANVGNTFVQTGGTVTGSVVISTDLHVTGNLYIAGNSTFVNANNISTNDSIILIGTNNTSNAIDLGIVGHFTNNGYQRTGFVRNHNTGIWGLFSNLTSEPSTTINWSDANLIYDKIQTGNITAPAIYVSGIELGSFANSINAYAYSAYSTVNTTASNITTLQGIENAQNTNITSAFAFANSVNVYAYSSYNFANSVNVYAYSAFAFANTVNNYSYSAYSTANSAAIFANAAFTQANVIFNSSNLISITANAAFAKANSVSSTSVSVVTYTGDGTTTQFNLGVTPSSINSTTVNYNGISLLRSSYSLAGSVITFSSAPANGALIEITILNSILATNTSFASGNSGNVQFASSQGVITSDPNFIYLTSNTTLTVPNIYASGNVTVNGNINVTGNVTYFNNVTVNTTETITNTLNLGGINVQPYITSSFSFANNASNTANLAFSNANAAFTFANSVNVYAYSSYNFANTVNVYAYSAYANANLASANTITLQGIENAQNTNISASFTTANAAYASQNITAGFANGAYATANASYASQNITAGFANAAFSNANSAGIFANGAYTFANTVNTYSYAAYASQNITASFANSAFAQSNSAVANTITLQGIENAQNTNISASFTTANASYASQNITAGFANGAYATANASYAAQNITAGFANGAYTFANTVNVYAYSAYANANLASSNTITLQGIENAQNTNISASFTTANAAYASQNITASFANSAYTFANTVNNYSYSAYSKANNALANTSNAVFSGNLNVTGNIILTGATGNISAYNIATNTFTATGLMSVQQSTENITNTGNPGSSTNYDFNSGPTYYNSGMAQNWTANFINVPTTQNKSVLVTLVMNQGATAYYPSVIQVNTTTYAPKWLNGSSYTGNASQWDFLTFAIINIGGTITVLGSYATYV